jgi:hypothetical protein
MAPSATIENHSHRFIASVVALGLLLGTAAFWGANKAVLGLFHDDGIYAVVGKALAQGDGHRILSLPGAPAQTKYPFLYSYLLSWLWALESSFPSNIALLKAFNIAIFVAIFFTAVLYYRRCSRDSTVGAILFGLVVCTNPIIFGFTDYVLSDLLLALFTLAALALCAGVNSENASVSHLLVLAAIGGFAFLTRSAGLPLVFAGAVHAFVFRGWRGAAWFSIAASLIVMPWLIWLYMHAQQPADSLFAYYTGYDFAGAPTGDLTSWLSSRLSIVVGNLRYLFDMFDLFYLTPLLPGSGILIGCLSLLGLIASARRYDPFMWSLVIFFLALLLIWPFHPGRYLAPLAPLIVLFLFRGLSTTENWLHVRLADFSALRWLAKLAWCPLAIVLLLNGVWLSGYLLIKDDRTTRGLYGRRAPYGWAGFEESFAWVRAHAAPEAVLATAYDPMYYLYTGRRAIRPALHRSASYFYPYGHPSPDVGTVAEIKPQLAKLQIDYLIIDPMDGYAEGSATMRLLEELVVTFGGQAERVFTSGDGKHKIYRIVSN